MTGFRGLADLGLLSAIGLFTCLAAFLTLFPALLKNHVPKVKRTFVAAIADGLAALPTRWPKATLAVALLLTAGAAGVLGLRGLPPFVSDMKALHTEHSPALRTLAELDRLVQRPLVPWVLLAEGADADELSDRFAALAPRLDALVADGTLTAFQAPTLVLPTRRDQEAAFAILGDLDPDAVVRTFEAKAEALGFAGDALQATGTMLRANLTRAARREPVTLDELGRLGAGRLVDTFFRSGGKSGAGGKSGSAVTTAAAYVFPSGGMFATERHEEVLARIFAAIAPTPEVALTGFDVVASELASRVRKDFRGVTALAIGVVVLLVLIGCRSFAGTALSLVPVGIAFVWMLAGMQLRGMPFNVLNVVLLPMLVGLGVDYGVHLVFDARETGDVARSARAVMLPMLVSAVTTVAGFGSLMGVSNPGVESMGELSAAGIGFTLIATIVVLAPLLRLRELSAARRPRRGTAPGLPR
jgi:predicted exporter